MGTMTKTFRLGTQRLKQSWPFVAFFGAVTLMLLVGAVASAVDGQLLLALLWFFGSGCGGYVLTRHLLALRKS